VGKGESEKKKSNQVGEISAPGIKHRKGFPITGTPQQGDAGKGFWPEKRKKSPLVGKADCDGLYLQPPSDNEKVGGPRRTPAVFAGGCGLKKKRHQRGKPNSKKMGGRRSDDQSRAPSEKESSESECTTGEDGTKAEKIDNLLTWGGRDPCREQESKEIEKNVF